VPSGDVLDHAAQRRHLCRRSSLVCFDTGGVANNVERDDRRESTGLRFCGVEGESLEPMSGQCLSPLVAVGTTAGVR